jgi:hypothetical protein
MTKISPIAAVAGIFFLLLCAYLIYDELQPTHHASTRKLDDNILAVEVTKDSLPHDSREIYKDKWHREAALARKVDNEEDFFATEVKKSPADSFFQPSAPRAESTPLRVTPKPSSSTIRTPIPTEPAADNSTAPEKKRRTKKGFASESTTPPAATNHHPTTEIRAVVQEAVLVKSGTSVLLRTLEPAVVKGITIPKNTLIPTVASLSQSHLLLTSQSFQVGAQFVSSEFSAFSLDGSEGIPIEGGVDQQIRKDLASDALSTAQQVIHVPLLKNIPARVGRQKLQDTSVPLSIGHELILRPRL